MSNSQSQTVTHQDAPPRAHTLGPSSVPCTALSGSAGCRSCRKNKITPTCHPTRERSCWCIRRCRRHLHSYFLLSRPCRHSVAWGGQCGCGASVVVQRVLRVRTIMSSRRLASEASPSSSRVPSATHVAANAASAAGGAGAAPESDAAGSLAWYAALVLSSILLHGL